MELNLGQNFFAHLPVVGREAFAVLEKPGGFLSGYQLIPRIPRRPPRPYPLEGGEGHRESLFAQ